MNPGLRRTRQDRRSRTLRGCRAALVAWSVLLAPPAAAQPAGGPPSWAEVVAAAAARYDGLFAERFSGGPARLRYVRGGSGAPVILLHGWPQTSREWRHVMPMLAEAGHDVVAVDLPGLGGSAPSPGGHDTHSAAEAVRALAEELGFARHHLAGHDVGGMVAFAYALRHPERVTRLALVEAPLPGIGDWERISASPALWHFGFHRSPGLPEALTAGRERDYLGFIFGRDIVVKDALGAEDASAYARSYAEPGRMAAGFGYYRAFDASAERNRALTRSTRLAMPVLAVGAEASNGAHQEERAGQDGGRRRDRPRRRGLGPLRARGAPRGARSRARPPLRRIQALRAGPC